MLKQAKQVLKKVNIHGVVRELSKTSRRISWHFKRQFGRTDCGIIERYCRAHEIRKLHVGCGGNVLDGWLNTTLFPKSSHILHLDVTEPFPFDNEEFDYVYT